MTSARERLQRAVEHANRVRANLPAERRAVIVRVVDLEEVLAQGGPAFDVDAEPVAQEPT